MFLISRSAIPGMVAATEMYLGIPSCADPEAADFVLSQPAKTRIVGLDITHSCTFTGPELTGLHGKGRFGTFLSSITAFYLKYHR